MTHALDRHPLYDALTTPARLRTFTEHHVVCVLDFMSLLKSLQAELAGARAPWTPPADPRAARLVTSIVLDEETDRRADGRIQSHFEWYREAMAEIGADTGPVDALVADLRAGAGLAEALGRSRLPAAARRFGLVTAEALEQPLPVRAAVFLHGREELIPRLFLPLVQRLAGQGLRCVALIEYLERHIEVDGGEHGPAAEAMLARLLGDDPATRAAAEAASARALAARAALWDAVLAAFDAPAATALGASP